MTPFQNGLGRQYLAAVTAAAISMEIAKARMLKASSDALSSVVTTTYDIPKVDALMIRSADYVTNAFADTVTAAGLIAMVAVFALAASRGKIATLALCALAATIALLGAGVISSALLAFVPMFSDLFVNGKPATQSVASAFSIPDAGLYAVWAVGLALTLTIAFLMARSTFERKPMLPA